MVNFHQNINQYAFNYPYHRYPIDMNVMTVTNNHVPPRFRFAKRGEQCRLGTPPGGIAADEQQATIY